MRTPLQTFRDIHKGKMAFLLGTGVSLDSVDIEKIRPYITMGINGSLFKMSDPDYLFSCDGGISRYGLLNIVSKNTHIILSNELDFTDEGVDMIMKHFEITKYSNVRRKWGIKEPEACTMRNTDEGLVFGLSSVHCAAHLLYIMGCEPIVLLGCDCKLINNVYSYWMLPQYKDKLTPSYIDDLGNASLPHTGVHKETMIRDIPNHLVSFAQYWDKMRSLAPQVFIIDACDSAIAGFKKMTLDAVLKEYGDKIK